MKVTQNRPMCRIALFLTIALISFGVAGHAAAPPIGFAGAEFYKLDWLTHNLRIADVNGDGRHDIVVVNNARACVECLLQRGPAAPPPRPEDVGPNRVPDDLRFRKRPYPAERKIFSLELGDLNGDGRTDMAFYGDPRELVVVFQDETGNWAKRRTFDIPDASTKPHALAIGDINGDNRNDIVLLGGDGLYTVLQDEADRLGRPVKESGAPSDLSGIFLRDVNGDGRLDLLYVRFGAADPISVRYQQASGRLGPELRCEAVPFRAVGLGDTDGDGRTEIAAVNAQSGRLVLYDFAERPPGEGLLEGALASYTLRNASTRQTPAWAFGDFSGSGRPEIAVTAPDANEIEFFFPDPAGGYSARAAFPTFQATADLAALVPPGRGRTDLIVLSREEGAIGLAAMDAHGRLVFPRSLPVAGKPTAMSVGDVTGDEMPEIVAAVTAEQERRLVILERSADGAFRESASVPMIQARSDPDGLRLLDINQDGRTDVCVFLPYEGLRVFKGMPDGSFADVSLGKEFAKGLVRSAAIRSIGSGDVDGDGKPELLLAHKNFARAVRLDAQDELVVVDQFNGRLPTSVIAGVAAADLDGDGTVEIILVDTGTRCLSVLTRTPRGTYEISENRPLGPIAFERIAVRDLTGDGRPEILLLTKGGFRILMPGRPRVTLRERAAYGTDTPNGRLGDVNLGDLDGDGRDELLAVETTRHAMALLAWDARERALRRSLQWPVFEAKSFGGSRFERGPEASVEPRECAVGDVTSDGKPDIVLLVHDRVIVYPQE